MTGKTKPIQTRLSLANWRAVRRSAAKAGASVATWLRQIVLRELHGEDGGSNKRAPYAKTVRASTGVPEFDEALGGGVVPGMTILLRGKRNVGKTLLASRTDSRRIEVFDDVDMTPPLAFQITRDAREIGVFAGQATLVIPKDDAADFIPFFDVALVLERDRIRVEKNKYGPCFEVPIKVAA